MFVSTIYISVNIVKYKHVKFKTKTWNWNYSCSHLCMISACMLSRHWQRVLLSTQSLYLCPWQLLRKSGLISEQVGPSIKFQEAVTPPSLAEAPALRVVPDCAVLSIVVVSSRRVPKPFAVTLTKVVIRHKLAPSAVPPVLSDVRSTLKAISWLFPSSRAPDNTLTSVCVISTPIDSVNKNIKNMVIGDDCVGKLTSVVLNINCS